MILSREKLLLLCNFDTQIQDTDSQAIRKLWSGVWYIENFDLCEELLISGLEIDQLKEVLKKYKDEEHTLNDILHLAISAFLTFCEKNWNPHADELSINNYFKSLWPSNLDAALKLQSNSEPVHSNIVCPELLYFSTQVLSALCCIQENLVNNWWLLRSKIVHQRVLEDKTAALYKFIDLTIAKLYNMFKSINDPRLQVLLYLEIAQAYVVYDRVEKVEEYLLKAKEMAGLKLELTGILGKRTKFQQEALPQLALTSELDSNIERVSAEDSHGSSDLPHDVELQDDVRLNKIEFNEKLSQAKLPSLEQTLCLLTVQYLQKSQPKDALLEEELRPYIDAVLNQKSGPWASRVAALLIRCKLEGNHKRTVERAMLQCETIVNEKAVVSTTNRLSYLWASGLPCAWTWRQQLADFYLSLGLVKAALEEYQKLQLWEDVIVCYTLLQLRHKAAEVIQQQIDMQPTVKLYCLLGDATDEVRWYDRAWEFSEHKSSRAQRHWGNFLFDRKRYDECIPHYEMSLQINAIQDHIWLRLGFAALTTEKWELAGKAYRRYTYLQPNTFEAWNNLAKVYMMQGEKERAYRALMEALRFNYDNWKLWTNVITVSLETDHFDDVIRGIHRTIDLQNKYEDVKVLALLVNEVIKERVDLDKESNERFRKRVQELFGRITSIHPNNGEIWQLYSYISPTYLLKAQRLLKTYGCIAQTGKWANDPSTCKMVIDISMDMIEYSIKARQELSPEENGKILQADQQLSSARLTGQAVIRIIEKQWPDLDISELKEKFIAVTEFIKSVI
ncbi:tetratricopeptide repeat protein 27 [Pieris rapae]|uniref:tetratricopeptide repeat protein 27 n=1 Tax=Pieris rapae TaxID=64459 RepID=UPI001E2805FD|nr:tetratricopeptide repeat protein 27 [Pieris rapae]XP_045485972.1 tetratricopeptide repeat protein 27 [Pieris rapae]